MEQPKKKVLLTPKRVKEIADSLRIEGYNSFVAARNTNFPSLAKEEYERSDIYNKNAARYRRLAEEAEKKEEAPNKRKQIQNQEMMKERVRQNKSNDKSSVIKLMRKIVG